MPDTKKVNYLAEAWLVLTLAVSFGASLAGVHLALNDGIEANKKNKTDNQIPRLIPGASKDRVEVGTFTTDIDGGGASGPHRLVTSPRSLTRTCKRLLTTRHTFRFFSRAVWQAKASALTGSSTASSGNWRAIF